MDMPTDGNQEPPQSPEEVVEPKPSEAVVEAQQEESGQQDQPPALSSREEALADVRRSLREEETHESTGFGARFRKFMARIFPGKAAPAEETTEAPSRLDALQFPEPPPPMAKPAEQVPGAGTGAAERTHAPGTTRPAETKADFESLVEARLTTAFRDREEREPIIPVTPVIPPTVSAFEPAAEQPAEEEPAVPSKSILAGLHQEGTESPEEPSIMREEALQDYVLEPEESPQETGAPMIRNLRRSWRYMRPTERRLLIAALVIIGLFALAGSGFLVVKSIPTPTPVVTPTTTTVPVPISVSLPGGWVFPLRTGFVQNGKWDPKSAEWLQGTEVCRWVSLPWTVQLEAVLRTLKGNDPIQLSMSNYDSIVYKVQSIEQVPSGDIAKLASDSPCLLLILSKENSDTRWVVTAKP
jgi:hypothetical protein